jgi:hypothetical protein
MTWADTLKIRKYYRTNVTGGWQATEKPEILPYECNGRLADNRKISQNLRGETLAEAECSPLMLCRNFYIAEHLTFSTAERRGRRSVPNKNRAFRPNKSTTFQYAFSMK